MAGLVARKRSEVDRPRADWAEAAGGVYSVLSTITIVDCIYCTYDNIMHESGRSTTNREVPCHLACSPDGQAPAPVIPHDQSTTGDRVLHLAGTECSLVWLFRPKSL